VWYTQGCTVAHGACGGQQQQEDDTDSPDGLTVQAERLVSVGDLQGLARLADSPQVLVNPERQAVQVLSCDRKQIYGHVPLGERAFAELEALFAQCRGVSTLPRHLFVPEFAQDLRASIKREAQCG
jgi:hypothetical protein